VHTTHHDYITVVSGEGFFGLRDLRTDSRTEGVTHTLRLNGDRMQVLRIPPGVAHGFCFTEASTLFYAVTHTWNLADELGCRYDDPGLEISWPVSDPLLSPRDQAAGSLEELRRQVPALRPAGSTVLGSTRS